MIRELARSTQHPRGRYLRPKEDRKDGEEPLMSALTRCQHQLRADEDPEDSHEYLIRLKRIYNFLCSMLVFTPFALCFVTLRGIFMRFLELTY
jgi:hypothetical protein